MSQDRVCAALILGSQILMVQHAEAGGTYWTLPGGGIEPGETAEHAASRELHEETGVRALAVELLWQRPANGPIRTGTEYCYLMKLENHNEVPEIELGFDPEEAHLPPESRLLTGVAWKQLLEVQNDPQISAVLQALR